MLLYVVSSEILFTCLPSVSVRFRLFFVCFLLLILFLELVLVFSFFFSAGLQRSQRESDEGGQEQEGCNPWLPLRGEGKSRTKRKNQEGLPVMDTHTQQVLFSTKRRSIVTQRGRKIPHHILRTGDSERKVSNIITSCAKCLPVRF